MNMFKIAVIGLAILTLSACATKIQYGDAQAVETVDTGFGSTDLQIIAEKMVSSLVAFPPVMEITQRERPILFVDQVRNKTREHIDTESVTDTIVNKLLRSGQFQFVDPSAIEAVQAQLGYQRNSGLVDPSKAAKVGKQVGARYMVYGNLSSIAKRNNKEKDIYFKFTLKMMDIESGLLVWQDEKEIRKTKSRSWLGV